MKEACMLEACMLKMRHLKFQSEARNDERCEL